MSGNAAHWIGSDSLARAGHIPPGARRLRKNTTVQSHSGYCRIKLTMSENKIIERIKEQFGSIVIDNHDFRGDQTVTVKKTCGNEFFKFLRDDPELAFNFLMDITAVDYFSKKDERFEVVYHFYSLHHNHRLRVKIPVSLEDCIADSITPLWKTANWYEREIWDMYGIKFRNHPNLRRILLYEEFKGHPLRKDYPITKRQPLIGPLN